MKNESLRCFDFTEVDMVNLMNFQPDKELCGGRDIREEQRHWEQKSIADSIFYGLIMDSFFQEGPFYLPRGPVFAR